MNIHDEREAFSQRLKQALKDAGERVDSPTLLARAFNRRYPGNPVSVHAARKWLYGEAIPGQDKLRVFSLWLGLSAEWLRFGDEVPQSVAQENPARTPELDYSLMRAIAVLTPAHQKVVSELVNALAKAEST